MSELDAEPTDRIEQATIHPTDPIKRTEPDFDPGLEPDPKHRVEENPPEGAGPTTKDE